MALALSMTASLLVGAHGFKADLGRAFRDSPRSVFSPEFRAQREQVTRIVPPGETLLHISATPEVWYSRLWQRSLYPRNAVIVVQPPVDADRLRELRAKYAARFAISAGSPPIDPGYRSRVALGPLAGQPGDTWFGELVP